MNAVLDPRATLADHIGAADFPCIGAKAALAQGRLRTLAARDIACPGDDAAIHSALAEQAHAYRRDPIPFRSLAVIFDTDRGVDEAGFEAALWQRIRALGDRDAAAGHTSDPRVSPDPADLEFAPSFAGEAFYVVGLHPKASRPARRLSRPAMVFNIHDQFVTLRREGRYTRLRERIAARDIRLAGSRDPMLADHGERSAASQYSGRMVGEDWVCPFAPRNPDRRDAA